MDRVLRTSASTASQRRFSGRYRSAAIRKRRRPRFDGWRCRNGHADRRTSGRYAADKGELGVWWPVSVSRTCALGNVEPFPGTNANSERWVWRPQRCSSAASAGHAARNRWCNRHRSSSATASSTSNAGGASNNDSLTSENSLALGPKQKRPAKNRGSFFRAPGGGLRSYNHSVDAIAVAKVVACLVRSNQFAIRFTVLSQDT